MKTNEQNQSKSKAAAGKNKTDVTFYQFCLFRGVKRVTI